MRVPVGGYCAEEWISPEFAFPGSTAVSAERGQFVIVVSSKALGMTGLNHGGNRSGSADSMASRRLSPS